MKKWLGWRSEYANNNYDVIIIGSGISGLTSGILLAQKGKKVLILEKHFKAGGWTHTFKRKKYEWDVGIHYIGEVHNKKSQIRKLFDIITNGQLDWYKMDDNYDRIIFPDKQYNFVAPKEKFISNMVDYFPGTEDKIIQYINKIDQSVKSGQAYFANKALPNWMGKIKYKKMTDKFFLFSDITTENMIMEIFNDKTIMGVLAGQWGDYGLPPSQSSFAMHAMVARHYFDGGNYPVGTSRKIAETAVNYLESMGGELYVNAGVNEIIVNKNKAIGVRLDSGEEVLAKTIISSAGIMNTYNTLLKKNKMSNKLFPPIENVKSTESYICLYLGLNKSAKDLNFKNTNLWIYPGYDHDNNVQNYLKDNTSELPVVYVSFPSAKDPEFQKNNPNHSTMEVISIATWKDYISWQERPWKKRGMEYEGFKNTLSKKILKNLYKYVPGIEKNIEHMELSTPLSVKSLANYSRGELYGIDHTPIRFRQDWIKPKTKIKNLYLTGQDIISVGVASALFSGLLTASTILKKNLLKELKII